MRTLTLVLATVVFLSAGVGHSDTVAWDGEGGAGDTAWSTASNWVGDVVPAAGDTALFSATGGTVTVAGETIDTVDVTAANWNFTGTTLNVTTAFNWGSTQYISWPARNTIDAVLNGTLYLTAGGLAITKDGGLGTATAIVSGGASSLGNQGLMLAAPQTAATPVRVNAGGALHFGGGGYNTPLTHPTPVVLNGGVLAGGYVATPAGSGYHGPVVSTGAITVEAPSSIYLTAYGDPYGSVELQGQITSASKITRTALGAGSTNLILNNAANASSFSGGMDIFKGPVNVAAAGSLGTGTVNVSDGGLLRTSADGALDSVLVTGGNPITIDAGGAIDFNSTELASGGTLTVKSYAAIMQSGGSTDLGNISDLYSAAILHTSVPSGAYPTQTQVAALPHGDGRYGLYLGHTASFTADYTNANSKAFGSGATGSIFRGIAVINNKEVNMAGTCEEVTGGSDGIALYVQPGSRLNIGTWSPVEFVTTGTLSMEGGGEYYLYNADSVYPDAWEMNGTNKVQLPVSGAIPAGKTLDVRNGHLTNYNDGGTGIAGTVNVWAGAGYLPGVWAAPDSGRVNIKAGGALILYMDSQYKSGLDLRFEVGSQTELRDYTWTGSPPGGGKTDYLINYAAHGFTENVVLGDNTRIMNGLRGDGTPESLGIGRAGYAGKLVLDTAGAATQGKVAAIRGSTFNVNLAIDLDLDGVAGGPAGTLLINDPLVTATSPGPYKAVRDPYGAAVWPGFSDVYCDGTVYLRNTTSPAAASNIGAIRINSGTLRIYDPGDIGGAATVELAGGKFYSTRDQALATTFTGSGLIDMAGSRRLTVTAGGGISPGTSAGRIDITGSLTLDEGQLVAEILGDGGNAGTDHDYVTVSGDADISTGGLLVKISVPKAGLDPEALNATLLTAGTLTGTFTAVAAECPQPLNPAVTPAVAASFYDFAAALDYSGDEVAVVGSAGSPWTGHLGDANLDDAVDVFDLAVVANNYQVVAPQDWTTADYDLSGAVDVFDLAALANNYGWTAGGGPVPEPATLALLAIGGAILIRRKRR